MFSANPETKLPVLPGTPSFGKPVTYVVMDEHTLGYLDDRRPNYMDVLFGSIFKGGRDWKNGSAILSPGLTRLRPATLADFEAYRCQAPSHFSEAADLGPLYSQYVLRVLESAAGFYIGTFDDECGPLTRDSAEYWPTRELAQAALNNGTWTKRERF